MSKEQYLSKIASVIQGINYGKDTDEASLKRIANSLESVTKEKEKSIVEILNGGSGGGCVPTTWAELKSLRDNSQLSPGTLYRITDYVATTTQERTKSANHPFDIIVVALDEKTLSEDAGAIAHSEEDLAKYKSVTWTDASGTHTAPFLMEANVILGGKAGLYIVFARDENTWVLYNPQHPKDIVTNLSTEDVEKTEDGYVIIGEPELEYAENYTIESGYFAYSNLPAWQLKYCLDNDTNRFAWAKAPIPASPADPGTYPATQVTWKFDPGSGIYRRTPDDDMELNGTLYYGWRGVKNSSRKTGLDDPTIQWDDLWDEPIYTLTDYVRKGTSPFYQKGDDDTMFPYTEPIIRLSSIPCPAEPGGNGVIYWMKDEHNNEAPFDFKGILLLLPQNWFETNSDWVVDNLFNMTPTDLWLYTFAYFDFRGLSELPTDFQSVVIDGSVVVLDDNCGYNKIMLYHNYENGITTTEIPTNIFFGTYANEFGRLMVSHTKNNILNADCNLNIFAQECSYNIFDCRCVGSKVWSNSTNNKVGILAYELKLSGTANTIMNNCRNCNVQGTHNIIMGNCRVTFSAYTAEAIVFPETGGEIDFGQYASYQYPKFAGSGGMESTGIIQFTLDQLSLIQQSTN